MPDLHATKLTDARLEALLKALRHGQTRRAACAVAGISKTTFYRMLEADDGTLRDTIERAEGEAEATHVAIVAEAAAKGTWQASAWWLERRRHEDYAQHQRVEMTLDVRKEAERLASQMGLDPDAVMAEADAILRGNV